MGILEQSLKRGERRMPKITILPEYCKSCGLCIKICPKKVLAIGDKANSKGYYTATPVNPEKCVGCALCATVCPDIAIEIYK
jgi:2-oxoglutarate ferredoxin oxidoreductase subunit delta